MNAEAMSALTSDLEELQQLGLYTGLGDIYIAFMTKEETATDWPEYTTPILAAEGISFGLTPNYNEGKLSASDRTLRKLKIINSYTVKMEYPRIKAAIRAALLGHVTDQKGGTMIGDGTPPYVAVGVKATRDDGTVHMRWLYKVRFSEQTVDDKTAEEGTIDYRIPVLEGEAIKLGCHVTDSDGHKVYPLRYDADTSMGELCTWTEESFFTAVPKPAAE